MAYVKPQMNHRKYMVLEDTGRLEARISVKMIDFMAIFPYP